MRANFPTLRALSLAVVLAGCAADRPLDVALTCQEALDRNADDCLRRRPDAAILSCRAALRPQLSAPSRDAWDAVWSCWHGSHTLGGGEPCARQLDACRDAL